MLYIGLDALCLSIREVFEDYRGDYREGDVFPRDQILRRFADSRDNPMGMASNMMLAFGSAYDKTRRNRDLSDLTALITQHDRISEMLWGAEP